MKSFELKKKLARIFPPFTSCAPLILVAILCNVPVSCSNIRMSRQRGLADDGVLTEEDKQQLLDAINKERGDTAHGDTGTQPMATNMVELIWDEDLAVGAKEHADGCKFQHAQQSALGETLYTAGSTDDDIDNIDQLITGTVEWYQEQLDYDYYTGVCGGAQCTHYTQLVWAESKKVGCAYATCVNMIFPAPYELLLVCRFDPKGNWIGEFPYEETDDFDMIASNCPPGYFKDPAGSGLCLFDPEFTGDDGTDDYSMGDNDDLIDFAGESTDSECVVDDEGTNPPTSTDDGENETPGSIIIDFLAPFFTVEFNPSKLKWKYICCQVRRMLR